MDIHKLDKIDLPIWSDPAWYQGLYLVERLAAIPGRTDDFVKTVETNDLAGNHLQAWKTQRPFEQAVLFAQRLEQDDLTEQVFLALLGEPGFALQERFPGVPGWLATLQEAFSAVRRSGLQLSLSQEILSSHPLGPCLPAIAPLLQRALNILSERVAALQQAHKNVPFDLSVFTQIYIENLAPDLLFQMSKPVILEMHIARLEGRLHGETPEERFMNYMDHLTLEDGILRFLTRYPVLARQLVQTIDQWTDYAVEFLAHLFADWPDLCDRFSPDNDLGLLVALQVGAGDRHRNGRSVLIAQYASGLRLVYKPKPFAIDAHFQELLVWLNQQGASPSLRTLKVIDRGEYGWSEFVEPISCTTEEEIIRFYERQGSYLALLYALNAVDLHNENIIAAGEHPMLVDLEALFHPRLEERDTASSSNQAALAMDESVWQVGLLPRRLWSAKDSGGVDMSGLGGGEGQLLPHPLFTWKNPGTDQMQLVRQQVEMPVSQNRPRLKDQEVNVLDYQEAVLSGFTHMYRLLYRLQPVLLDEQLRRFEHDEIRFVARSTRIYATLMFESFHPDLLQDALMRDRFFDHLWREVQQRPYLSRLIPFEQRDLLRWDIPLFTTTPSSTTIYASEKEPLANFLDVSSLEIVREKLRQLSEADLARQVWIIRASFTTLQIGNEDIHDRPLPSYAAPQLSTSENFQAQALAIGRRLEELAYQNEAGAYWLGVNYVDEHSWSLFPTGPDLYNGIGGIALFLAYLGVITGEESPTQLAHRALATLTAQVAEQEQSQQEINIGAFSGLAGSIYLLAHLGVLWSAPALFLKAEMLVERLALLIPQDKQYDIINGSAGSILSLLALYSVHPTNRTLEVAVQCGNHLLNQALEMPAGIGWETIPGERPLGGFSHGAAGIAFSLMKLSHAAQEEIFRESAHKALAYDRSLYIPAFQNWADLRIFPNLGGNSQPYQGEPVQKAMVAWCHGAPGIGLGRLGAMGELDNEEVRTEIDIALDTTIRAGVGSNHSLCHGAFGNLELLLAAAQTLNRPRDQAALAQRCALLMGSLTTNGWVTAVPGGVETPGLMIGLAGIGYELLRLAHPNRVSSLLLLEPPSWSTAPEAG